jgi:tetratricopeptide (TPR) repeat protein
MVKAVKAVDDDVRKVLLAQKDLTADRLLEIAQSASERGCSGLTLKLLEEHSVLIEQHPQAQLQMARLMLEAGRSEEAYAVLGKLEPYVEKFALPDWYYPAGHAGLSNGDYNRATRVWHDELLAREADADPMFRQGFLATLPFITPSGSNPVAWPLNQILVGTPGLQSWSNQRAEIQFQIAQCHLESGRCDDATTMMKRIIELNPDSPLRPLIRVYLALTSDKVIELSPDYQWQESNADSLHPNDEALVEELQQGSAKPGEQPQTGTVPTSAQKQK